MTKKNPHILIVEDEPRIVQTIQREVVIGVGKLEDPKIGAPIITIARNSLEALAAYAKSELITLDIMGVGVPEGKNIKWARAIADYAQSKGYYSQRDFNLPAKVPEDGYDLLKVFNLLRIAEAEKQKTKPSNFSGKPIIIYAAQKIIRANQFDTKGKDITELLFNYVDEMGKEIETDNQNGWHPAIVLEKKGFAGQSRLPILRQWMTYYLQQAEYDSQKK